MRRASGAAVGTGRPVTAAMSTLREMRQHRGLTLEQLARMVHVSPACLSRWETGLRSPHPDQWPHLARGLDVPAARIGAAVRQGPARLADAIPAPGLRNLRRRAGLDRRELADRLGVSVASVAHWETGRRRVPVIRLPALAAACAMDLETLHRRIRIAPSAVEHPLTKMRQRAGLTQRQAADALGVSSSCISSWEHDRTTPRWAHVRRLSALYEQPLSTVAVATRQSARPHPESREWTRAQIGELLRVTRQWQGLSRAEVARDVGVHPETLARWEAGSGLPDAAQCHRLEPALGLREQRLANLAAEDGKAGTTLDRRRPLMGGALPRPPQLSRKLSHPRQDKRPKRRMTPAGTA